MRIQHNIMAMGAYRNYTNNVNAMKKNLEKLSSGYKINRAGDDAAGLAISEKMRAQITGLETAQKNAKDGISRVQTAEGALTEVHDMLNRMVTLATQSANGTYDNDVDRVQLQKELDQLRTEIDRIADSSNFNGIKLFDGSLSDAELTTDGVVTSSKSITDGLTINDGTDGGGAKGTFSIDLTGKFGEGDTLDINFSTNAGITGNTLTLTYQGTNPSGNNFNGATVEEQATNIAKILSGNANVAQHFDVSTDGGKVTLTAKEEGVNKPAVTSVKVTDKNFGAGSVTTTAGTSAAANALLTGGGFTKIFDGGAAGATASLDLKEGDVLTFQFANAAGGSTLFAQVKVTADMINGTNEQTTKAVVDALNEAYFIDVTEANKNDIGGSGLTTSAGTVADESLLKVSDLFDIAANKTADATGTAEIGSIQVKGKLDGDYGVLGVKRTNADDSSRAATFTQAADVNGAVGATAHKAEFTGGTTADKMTAGDKITISGQLSDGRTFSLVMEAGKDFDISSATSYQTGMNALKAQLEKTGDDATMVKLSDGKEVKAGDIFGAGKEITITTSGTGVAFESVTKGVIGKGAAGGITSLAYNSIAPAKADASLTKGSDPTEAESSFTLDNDLTYGTAITVDGKTYELVKDARDVTNRSNEAVVMTDLSDLSAVASAFADSINRVAQEKAGTGNTPDYTATADGATVKITTSDTGSDVKAMAITTPYGDDVPTLEFTFDPKKVQAGSTITIKTGDDEVGKTYEFVKTGEKAKSGNIAIEVADFDKATAKSLGDAFAKVAQGITPEVADDGKVTITANEVDGKIPSLSAKFSNGKAGLKLQIGDTADEYNQMKVSIYKMKCADMGIGNISILDQDSAGAAIDKIRSAINYVSDVRGTLGATQNRLDHTINNLSVMQENIQDAESTIRDTDVAAEMMAYTKNNILIQSAQAMLAQANQVPQGVLQLLQ